jgi:hypothetical protein
MDTFGYGFEHNPHLVPTPNRPLKRQSPQMIQSALAVTAPQPPHQKSNEAREAQETLEGGQETQAEAVMEHEERGELQGAPKEVQEAQEEQPEALEEQPEALEAAR